MKPRILGPPATTAGWILLWEKGEEVLLLGRMPDEEQRSPLPKGATYVLLFRYFLQQDQGWAWGMYYPFLPEMRVVVDRWLEEVSLAGHLMTNGCRRYLRVLTSNPGLPLLPLVVAVGKFPCLPHPVYSYPPMRSGTWT